MIIIFASFADTILQNDFAQPHNSSTFRPSPAEPPEFQFSEPYSPCLSLYKFVQNSFYRPISDLLLGGLVVGGSDTLLGPSLNTMFTVTVGPCFSCPWTFDSVGVRFGLRFGWTQPRQGFVHVRGTCPCNPTQN